MLDKAGAVIGVEIRQVSAGAALEAHRRWERFFISSGVCWLSRGLPTLVRRRIERLERTASPRMIRARGGVALSTGGFSQNRGMVAQYAKHMVSYSPRGTAGSDGAGIRLGQTAGGKTHRMENFDLGRHIATDGPCVKGIVVNGEGRRFLGEDCYLATMGHNIAFQQNGTAWIIVDREIYEAAWNIAKSSAGKSLLIWLNGIFSVRGGLKKGATLASLASASGMPADNLV